ncbi:MAG: hypothetical protein IKJ82_08725 [Oscillospiraceae bacterium]|nr:hypothetical protein [Oscillospiraceae bacterium]
MYYDIEDDFREPEPDIDEQLKELKGRKAMVEKEFSLSEKSDGDKIKYYYSLLAIEERKSKLLDKKYWKEKVNSANISSDLESLRKQSVYDFSKMLFYFLLSGFLLICSKYGVPSDIIGSLSSIVFAPVFALFTVIPLIFISSRGGIIGRYPKISALILFILFAIVVLIAY